jgi:hypothetical protein
MSYNGTVGHWFHKENKIMKKKTRVQNKNAVIVSRVSRTGNKRTETARRDNDAFEAAITTFPRNDRTSLFIHLNDEGTHLRLTGREARTLYRVLQRHYDYLGKAQ